MVQIRKPPKYNPPPEFVPWTIACFHTEEARDGFLRAAATLPVDDVEVKPVHGESCRASVRWRSGKFLGLNDVAYAHGGRIVLSQQRAL